MVLSAINTLVLVGEEESEVSDVINTTLSSFWGIISNTWNANWQWLLPIILFFVVTRFPMLGRGPGSSKKDPLRLFKFGARATVMKNAGGRCEGPLFFVFGRCRKDAAEADHVFPHSKGGPTAVSNGQALCKPCNRRKGSMTPSVWYIKALEKRRKQYFPPGRDVRVFAYLSEEEAKLRPEIMRRLKK